LRALPGYLAMVLLLLLPCASAAQRHAGIIIEPPAGSYTPQLSALSDAIVNAIAALPGWEVVLLDDSCACVRAASAQKQFAQLADHNASDSQLLQVALLVDLDDLLLVRISVSEAEGAGERISLNTRWARTDEKTVSGFEMQMPGFSSQEVKAASDRFAARITKGPTTPAQVLPATDSAPPVDTQPPAADSAPPPAEPPVADTQPRPADTNVAATPADHPGAERLAAARTALAIGDLDLARREADMALRQGASVYDIHMFRADLSVADNQPEEQRKWLERAAQMNPEAVAPLLRLGAVLAAQGLWQKSIESYDRAIALDPSSVSAYTGAAAVLMSRGRPKQAASYLAEAVAHNPGDNVLLARLGDAYRQANMPAEAEEAYDLAVRTAEPQLAAQVFDKLGDLYVAVGQFEEGFYCYAEAGRLRGGGQRPIARKRYEQIMATADEAIMSALESASEAFDAYHGDRSIPRERAYLAAEQADAQVAEVSSFAADVLPPGTVEQVHLRRQLFYNLAAEAIVALMTYLDTNMESAMAQYHRAAHEARAEHEALHRPTVP
jgi:tetratricopeptide (TPR) repeat protein